MGCVEAQQTIDLASNVALQAADDLLLTEPLAGAASDVLTGTRIGGHSDQHDDPQGAISLSITAAVEAMAVLPAGGRVDRTDATQGRKRGFSG